jgi:nitrogen fixation/metabolism regulation signal transduction histidine kinase
MELEINRKVETANRAEEYRSFEIGIPVMRNQQMIGLVRTTMSLKDIQRPLQLLYYKSIAIIFGILIIGFWVSFFMLSRLNRPLSQLTAAVEKISAGDLSISVPITTRDEIGRLAESFNQAAQKLAEQKQLETKVHQLERQAIVSELSSCLAHEIRNPLNLIMLTASHLGNHFIPEDQEQCLKYKEYIASLKTEVKHLNQMVGNFMSMGKSTEIIKTKFRLPEFLGQIRALVKQQLISKDISLDVSEGTEIELFADEDRMQLVFLNLILNAISVVPLHGKIEVQARKVHDSGEVLVSVTDNGQGIKSEDVDRIFEPYFSERPGGTGLGLAVVKRIVEEHDGQISAGNSQRGGARFDITLPGEES